MSCLKDELQGSIETLKNAEMISEEQYKELYNKIIKENFYNWKLHI